MSDERRTAEPRRLAEILDPALDRLATSEQARAYRAWARAAGDQVGAGARPRRFAHGVLTLECASSVWANELTYLGGQLIARMDEVAPGHPVKRFRFLVAGPAARQEDDAVAVKKKRRDERPSAEELAGARAEAEGVRDDRLRAAILAALRDLYDEPRRGP